jgi:orotate phosphoribosyltransferase
MNRKTIAELLLDIKAVTINVEAPYHYSSGIISPIYCDNRLIISCLDERKVIIDTFLEIIDGLDTPPDVIAGTATAAIPFAAWVSNRLDLPMVYARSGQKGYGKEHRIEGTLTPGQKVLFTEDLVTTGGGVLKSAEDVAKFNVEVIGVATIFEYGLPAATEGFQNAGLPKWSMADFVTILDVMSERGELSDDNRNIALDWQADPRGWGSKMGFE